MRRMVWVAGRLVNGREVELLQTVGALTSLREPANSPSTAVIARRLGWKGWETLRMLVSLEMRGLVEADGAYAWRLTETALKGARS